MLCRLRGFCASILGFVSTIFIHTGAPVMARLLLILDELFPVRGAPQVRAQNLLAAIPEWERFGLGGQLSEGALREGFYPTPAPLGAAPDRIPPLSCKAQLAGASDRASNSP